MKKLMKYFAIAFFCSLTVFYGCKKTATSNKEILSTHNWYFYQDVQDTVGSADTINRQIPVCATDDYLSFDEGGGMVYHTGDVKCDTAELMEYTMTYDASSGKTIVITNYMGNTGLNFTWNILKLNTSVLEVAYTNPKTNIYHHTTFIAK